MKRDLVPAVCEKGHIHRWWGGPFMVPRGSGQTNVWGRPLRCKCGAQVSASA